MAYASRSLQLSQRRYCTTRREMLAAVSMCTHFRSYLWGAQFTLRTDHRSLRRLRNFRNSDGMLARWYMLLGQFSLKFEYRPGAQHANADGLSHQCGQCLRPVCPVSSPEGQARGSGSTSALLDQPLASSAMGDSMDAALLPELSGETWVAATYLEEVTAGLEPAGSEPDFITASRLDNMLITVCGWDQSFIQRYHDSIFAGHLGVSRTVYHLLDSVYWPGLREDVRSYIASCSVCLARKSHRWDQVAMDILDMSVTTSKGNWYFLVMVDCFSRWTEACSLPNKTALAVAEAFFQMIVCRFGMPAVIHSDQGR